MEVKITFYKTILNEWLAIDRATAIHEVFYSKDGIEFLRLYVAGQSTMSDKDSYTVENPHKGFEWVGKITQYGKEFSLYLPHSSHQPIFRPTEWPKRVIWYVPLPVAMELRAIHSLPDGKFVFWTESKYDKPYEKVNFYFGHIDDLHQYEVLSSNGAQIVTTAGVLNISGRRFEGYNLTTLNFMEFEVVTEGEKIRLVHKKN